jgi:hypothetical protein
LILKPLFIRLLFISILSLNFTVSRAQFSVDNAWTIGKHNASSGSYLKTSFSGYYYHDEFSINSQLQVDIINPQERILSGLLLNASRDSVFQKFPIRLSAQYLFLPFSETLRESDISIIANGTTKGFSYALGINFRTYAYTQQAVKDYNIEQQRLHENWGLVYNFGYTYKPKTYRWDIGISFTNWDDFLINQDMNPFWRLKGQYHFDDKIELYTEANYIKSGVFNGSSNYFGYYIKTGIICHVN